MMLGNLLRATQKDEKRFFVHMQLPTLNEYTDAARANRFASAKMKKEVEDYIMWEIRMQLGDWKTDKPVFIVFRWVEKDRRRDHDNVAFAKKFVQDALVKSGALQGDGWKHVVGFLDLFDVDKNATGVEVILLEVDHE